VDDTEAAGGHHRFGAFHDWDTVVPHLGNMACFAASQAEEGFLYLIVPKFRILAGERSMTTFTA
jgi:hypothetical protein